MASKQPDSPSASTPQAPTRSRSGKRPKSFWFIGVVVAICLIPVGWQVARYTKRQWTAYQTRGFIQEAEAAIIAKEWETASQKLSKAYQLSPTDPNVLRHFAKFLDIVAPNAGQSQLFWHRLVTSGEATDEDRANYGLASLRAGKTADARNVLNSLSEATRKHSKAGLELEASLLQSQGKGTEAQDVMRQALMLEPENLDNKLRMAIQDLNNPFSEVSNEALEKLWEIARSDTPEALRASEVLTNDRRLTASQSKELMDLAEKNEKATKVIKLSLLASYLRFHPEEREAAIVKHEAELATGPMADQVALMYWLQLLNEPKRILAILPEDRAIKTRELFPFYTEALAREGQWEQLRKIIRNSATLPASTIDVALLEARISIGLQEPAENVRNHVHEAIRSAANTRDFQGLMRVCSIAERLGYDDLAVEAMQNIAEHPQHRPAMLDRIMEIQTRKLNGEAMLRTATEILKVNPDLQAMTENVLYLKLLLGFEMETILPQAQDLANNGRLSAPTLSFFKAFYAYRIKDVEAMKVALEAIDSRTLNVGRRAVMAGMLSHAGETGKAFAIAENVTPDALLEIERNFLRKAL